MDYPHWKNMPKSEIVIVLSWENVYESAIEITEFKLGRLPVQCEIEEIFNRIFNLGIKEIHGSFFDNIEYYCREYYSGFKK